MSVKSKIGMIAAMTALAFADTNSLTRKRKVEEDSEKLTDEEKQIKQYRKNGLQSFVFEDGTIIWARNYKNALRKYKNLNP